VESHDEKDKGGITSAASALKLCTLMDPFSRQVIWLFLHRIFTITVNNHVLGPEQMSGDF
jgi:hypothetical protein